MAWSALAHAPGRGGAALVWRRRLPRGDVYCAWRVAPFQYVGTIRRAATGERHLACPQTGRPHALRLDFEARWQAQHDLLARRRY